MTFVLPYPTVTPEPEGARPSGWLREAIMGTQVPHLITTGHTPSEWADMDLQRLVGKLGAAVRTNLIVSPTGIVGYYNTGLVRITLRDERVWGQATVSRLLPQEELELPHVQIAGTLGAFAEYFRDKEKDARFITQQEHVYLRTSDHVLPQVRDALPQGIPTDDATLECISVYLSHANTTTNLHWDLRSGAMAQLRGRKRVIMFPPSELTRLPMHPSTHVFARRSHIDGRIDEEAFSKFDVLKQARGVICDIAPGDWLYIPAGWLHNVITLDDNCISLIATFRR